MALIEVINGTVDIAQISIPPKRARTDLGDIDGLAESIGRLSLIEPIVIDKQGALIAGFRRLTACTRLGVTRVPVRIFEELSELERLEIELEENIARKDLTWWEAALFKKRIHELKIKLHGELKGRPMTNSQGRVIDQRWSITKTAAISDSSLSETSKDLKMADAIEVMPNLIHIKDRAEAMRIIDRLAYDIERHLRLTEPDQELNEFKNILHGDCLAHLPDISDGSIDCIITDPPYGIDAHTHTQSFHSRGVVHYDDSAVAALELLEKVAPHLRRVLRDDGHFYAFFGISTYPDAVAIYKSAGLDIDLVPCIWAKGWNRAGVADWTRRFAPDYEPFFNLMPTARKFNFVHGKIFQKPDNIHEPAPVTSSEKPMWLIEWLMLNSTVEGETVLDPFAGRGAVAVAAAKNKRNYIVIEKDEAMCEMIKERILDLDEPEDDE